MAVWPLALACLCASGVAVADSRSEEVVGVESDMEMDAFVARFLAQRGQGLPSQKEMGEMAIQKVSPQAAAKMLEGKLPGDVESLINAGVEGKAHQPFEEASLAKARRYLNEMMFKAWQELDDKVIACKEFEDKSRGSQEQIKTDIARLGEQIADLERVKAMTIEYINIKDGEITDVQEQIRKETAVYMNIYLVNKREMAIRRADMAVFQFMMVLTKCKKAAALAQLDASPASEANICDTEQGLTLDFSDKAAEEKLERMMTPSARAAVREVLERMEADRAQEEAALLQHAADGKADGAAFLQEAAGSGGDDDDSADADGDGDDQEDSSETPVSSLVQKGGATTMTTTTTRMMAPPAKKSRVVKRLDVRIGGIKCPNKPPDCGLLHDKMSLMWGKFKDLVDELQAEMDKNEFEWKSLMANFNQQLDVMRTAKTRFIMELNEATAGLNSDREEMAEKEEEYRVVMKEYTLFMRKCAKRIRWIFFQDFCAYFVVRAKVMVFSKVSPPGKIVDCAMENYIPGECSVPCDDACPNKNDPYACGGWQTLTRGIMVAPNEFGIKCPGLTRQRKCNQIKCPVDCVMSRWSAWSKCSKDCEGGVQGHTRNIITKPKNGGKKCNTAQESRACNTGSCDRNCKLKKWTTWAPCSVACGGGDTERWRRVLIPIRGEGKCPKGKSHLRYNIKKCNVHKCQGDEVCIAKQDLIISIDGSGSLTENRFKIMKAFVAGYVGKYMGKFYGLEDMKIGVVQFGNGEIMPDGSIAEALLVQELTHDMAKVKAAVEGLVYKKGFTNMAQAFTVSEKALNLGGRQKAMSAVLTITDGKPSFLFQTYEMVMQLKDKAVKLFFAPVTAFKGNEMKLMKKWASRPWMTNLVRIPGFAPMAADSALFQQKMLVKFCPEAISPSTRKVKEREMGYMLVRENGHCGTRGVKLSGKVMGAADCAALAQGAKVKAFSLGTHYARGRCYAEALAVTDAMIAGFNKDRANPACPGGEWAADELYDFYALIPLVRL